MNITKEEFDAYEIVRRSGVTNMFDVNKVCAFSGLDKARVYYIMRNYGKLKENLGILSTNSRQF